MKAVVSVIIPHHTDLGSLATCLKALSRCDNVQTAEIIVVDNGVETVNAPLKARFPNVRFLFDPTPGAANARNSGVAAACADQIIFLDCDCLPHRKFLTAHLAALKNADIVGGDVLVTTPAPRSLTGAQAFERVFAFNQKAYINKKGFSVTANLSTHRWVFDHVGLFQSSVSEDLDWCHRARHLGYPIVFAPDAKVDHPARQSWEELTKKWRRLTSQSYALHRAHGGTNGTWVMRALAMPFSALAHTPKVLSAHCLKSPSERWSAVQTLFKLRLWRMWEMLKIGSKPPESHHLAPRTTHRFPGDHRLS